MTLSPASDPVPAAAATCGSTSELVIDAPIETPPPWIPSTSVGALSVEAAVTLMSPVTVTFAPSPIVALACGLMVSKAKLAVMPTRPAVTATVWTLVVSLSLAETVNDFTVPAWPIWVLPSTAAPLARRSWRAL